MILKLTMQSLDKNSADVVDNFKSLYSSVGRRTLQPSYANIASRDLAEIIKSECKLVAK